MGLLTQEEWTGSWIGDGRRDPEREEELYHDDPAPLFRKAFEVSRPVSEARLYISGLGYYVAYLNGERIGDHELDPGWTDYSARIFYSTYDVTEQLKRGENVVGVMLGNGWFNPLPLRMWGRLNLREYLPMGRPRFIAQLNITYRDGSALSIVTDESWKIYEGPILSNNIYLGEIYDARKEIEGWHRPGFDDAVWRRAEIAPRPLGQLQAQPQLPIKVTATLRPVSVTEPERGVFIFDFGHNFAGWIRLRLKGTAGTRVRLRYGELLYEDGTLNPMTSVCGQIKGKRGDENVGGPGSPEIAWQSDVYIASGRDRETYTPVEITGYPGRPGLNSLEGLRLNSALEEVGSFACSNTLLNRIQEMTCRTFLSNVFSVQSDCPHRERFGYGGDLAVTSDAFMLNYDMSTFYAKAVRDWHDAALPDGMLTDTAPFVGIQYCGVGWAMVHPHLLYQLYQYYGNRRLLAEQYETARRWLDLVASQHEDHIIRDGLSDHEGLEPAPAAPMATPLYYQSAHLLSRLAAILGREDDRERYADLAREIRGKYVREFLEPGTGMFEPRTQASQSFALYLDLVPPEERSAAIDFLLGRILSAHDGHLSTGIFGTKYLLDVLSRSGHASVAYTVASQKSFPGWGYMLASGATTLWEHWSMSENTFSHNHPMFGSVSEWFYKWLAGIQPHPEAVGFDRIIVRPQVAGDLTWVKARYRSIRGNIESSWQIRNNTFHLDITIPPNTQATVYIPAQDISEVTENGRPLSRSEGVTHIRSEDGVVIVNLESGGYTFTARPDRRRMENR